MKLEKIAKDLVTKSIPIGRKTNPGIKLARKRYGKVIDKIVSKKYIDPKKFKNKKLLQKLTDTDYGPLLILRGRRYYVKREVGEVVRFMYSGVSPECVKLANLIKREAWKRGAHILSVPYSSTESRTHLQLMP